MNEAQKLQLEILQIKSFLKMIKMLSSSLNFNTEPIECFNGIMSEPSGGEARTQIEQFSNKILASCDEAMNLSMKINDQASVKTVLAHLLIHHHTMVALGYK